jgi:DNA primase
MAKISPVSIKYMIHAKFTAEGALEKPDVIGALFGQTEGLLGSDLEMRELQKEGKIGRIEVDLERHGKQTIGNIKIPTALDQSETTLIGAAIETIERVGPSDAQVEVERIEDVRGSKRDYIIERAKKLMSQIEGSADSREISSTVKTSSRMAKIQEYGDSKLPCGDISGKEVIVVEGRADVLNLLRNGVDNVISMNGTKLPDEIKGLGEEKELTLFVDGDHGGELIVKNASENAKVSFVASAPDGKEVEELTGKEILSNLRKKVSVQEFLGRNGRSRGRSDSRQSHYSREREYESMEDSGSSNRPEKIEFSIEDKGKLQEIASKNSGSRKAVLLNNEFGEIKRVSAKAVAGTLKKLNEVPYAIAMDGTATPAVIRTAKEVGCYNIAAKNFASTDTEMNLISA